MNSTNGRTYSTSSRNEQDLGAYETRQLRSMSSLTSILRSLSLSPPRPITAYSATSTKDVGSRRVASRALDITQLRQQVVVVLEIDLPI